MSAVYFGQSLAVSSTELQAMINGLNPVPGTCIFIDICGSTLIKNTSDLEYWLPLIRNSLVIGLTLPGMSFLLKIIGDELMFFIPDNKLESNGLSYSTLYESLVLFMTSWGEEIDKCLLPLKAAIHHSSDVYPVTFFGSPEHPTEDYYGSGIDLSARLMSLTQENRIIISDDFYSIAELSKSEYTNYIKGPFETTELKGFEKVIYRHMTIKKEKTIQ